MAWEAYFTFFTSFKASWPEKYSHTIDMLVVSVILSYALGKVSFKPKVKILIQDNTGKIVLVVFEKSIDK